MTYFGGNLNYKMKKLLFPFILSNFAPLSLRKMGAKKF